MRPRLLRSVLLTCLAACGDPPGAATESAQTDTTAAASTTGATTSTSAPDPTTSMTDPTSGSGSAGASTSTTGASASTTDPGSTSTTTTTSSTGEASTGDPLDPELTLQHAQFKGTHNSYHIEPALPFDASHEYTHAPLDIQLGQQGVRAFELDVHKGLSDFEVYHITIIDSVSTCPTVQACLGKIKNWSDAHPDHLPIVVWFEIKDSTGGLPIDAGELDELDDLVRGVFPPDRLFTPDDLQGAHASPRDALDAEGWPPLAAMRGQVVLVLLNVDDGHAEDYTDGYTTLAGRAMFARAEPNQFTAPWAAIAKLGIGDTDAITAAHAARMLIATNVCGAGQDDISCAKDLADAQAAGIHMLKDDFPAKLNGKTYWLDLPDGNPARCNPVTAPPECTSVALENL